MFYKENDQTPVFLIIVDVEGLQVDNILVKFLKRSVLRLLNNNHVLRLSSIVYRMFLQNVRTPVFFNNNNLALWNICSWTIFRLNVILRTSRSILRLLKTRSRLSSIVNKNNVLYKCPNSRLFNNNCRCGTYYADCTIVL